MRGWSKTCWLMFGDWLAFGAPGVLPGLLLDSLGPVWRLLPRARQAQAALGPWLLSVLGAREQAGRAYRDWTARGDVAAWSEDAWQAQPLSRAEAKRETAWLGWGLSAELWRLLWLAEAPCAWLQRADWPGAQVRYWAFVASLARLEQLYLALARRLGSARARELLEAAAAQVERVALAAAPAA